MAGIHFARAAGKPLCKYGQTCYRKNQHHWLKFDHPDTHPSLASGAAADDPPLAAAPLAAAAPAAAIDINSGKRTRDEDAFASSSDTDEDEVPAATSPTVAGAAAFSSSSDDADDIVTLMSWNADSVLPGTENAGKLRATLDLLPKPKPDLILLQETKHVKKKGEGKTIDEGKTHEQVVAVAALLKPEYEFYAASPQLDSADADATFCHGTGVFVRVAGPLYDRGRLVQPPWDHDGHVAYWESPRGRIVGCYLPTPTKHRRRPSALLPTGPSQVEIRAQIDVHLRSLLEELVAPAASPPLLAVMGDLNVTLEHIDSKQKLWTGPAYTAANDQLRGTMDAVRLVDAWRARHAGEQRYSSFQRHHYTQSRVDLALVPIELMESLVDVDLMDTDGDWTHTGYTRARRSDHVPLIVRLRLAVSRLSA